tara:strand:+ start:6566 stop:6742 length:177 start_codon:yes stop_codon:yes gene_type:complete
MDQNNAQLTKIINELLEEWSDTQFNISSEAARSMLSQAIVERVQSFNNQIIEDAFCSK